MKKILSKFTVLLLIFSMIFTVNAGAVTDQNTLKSSITTTVKEIMSKKTNPAFGDEWSIIALARSGEKIPQSYYDTYYKSVEEKVKAETKKTVPFTSDPENDDWTAVNDLERIVIALNAIGKDPLNVNGVNLVNLIFTRENLAEENGVSGLTYALIAIDTKNYSESPEIINTRESIIKDMLSLRTKDGGFSWDSEADTADLDTTAMALQALAKYKDRSDVKEVINTGLDILKKNQTVNGDYVGSYMGYTYESPCTAAQVVVALDNLKINPTDVSSGFVKNRSLIDVIESYYVNGGGFKNSTDESEVNDMTTDQLLYALDSYKNLLEGKSGIYDMTMLEASDELKNDNKNQDNKDQQLAKPDKEEVKGDKVNNDPENTDKSVENQNQPNNELDEKDGTSEEKDEVETGDNSAYGFMCILIISGAAAFKNKLYKEGNAA